MLIGRPLLAGDEGQPLAVIGELALSRVNAAAADAVGRTLDVDGHLVTIVGVVREEFGGLTGFPRDLWLPSDPAFDRPAEVVARLRPGVTPAQAAAQLTAFAVRLAPP